MNARVRFLSGWILGWSALIAAVMAASIWIPVFSHQDPARGRVGLPRLFPFYYQTNEDAPMELATALGFPGIYRTLPDRINRPTEYAIISGLRAGLVDPVLGLFVPAEDPAVMWGAWPAREYLATYAIWISVNLALILGALATFHALTREYFGGLRATLACVLFFTSPIVLLTLREAHNGAFHLFTGMATLSFWHGVLRNRIAGRRLILAALGLGMLYLGKPCLNGFAFGIMLCLWFRQHRKLPVVLALVALPTLAWMAAITIAGLRYTVSDVSHFGAGVWILRIGSAGALFRETGGFLSAWFSILGESVFAPLLPLAGWGAWNMWGSRSETGAVGGGTDQRVASRDGSQDASRTAPMDTRRIALALFALAACTDMVFYFLLHRAHAVYGMNTAALIFVTASVGLVSAADRLAARWGWKAEGPAVTAFCLCVILILQFALNCRQLPLYPG
jgi:hypothetical protein